MGYCTDIWCIDGLSFHAKGIYCLLAKFVNKKGTCWPSILKMQEMSGLSKNTIIKAIRELAEKQQVIITQQHANKMKINNLYYMPNLVKSDVHQMNHDVQEMNLRCSLDEPSDVQEMNRNLSINNLSINDEDKAILDLLKDVPSYPFKLEVDLNFIRELKIDFPLVNTLEKIKEWKIWLIDKKPLTKKSNPRLQIRNWIKPKKWQAAKGENKHSTFKKEEWGY